MIFQYRDRCQLLSNILIHCKDISFGKVICYSSWNLTQIAYCISTRHWIAYCISTRHWIAYNEQHNEEYLIVFWGISYIRDNKQHYLLIGEFLFLTPCIDYAIFAQ